MSNSVAKPRRKWTIKKASGLNNASDPYQRKQFFTSASWDSGWAHMKNGWMRGNCVRAI